MSHPFWPQSRYGYRPLKSQAPTLTALGGSEHYEGVFQGPSPHGMQRHGYAVPAYIAKMPTGVDGYYEGYGADASKCTPLSEIATQLKNAVVNAATGIKKSVSGFTIDLGDIANKVPTEMYGKLAQEINNLASKTRDAIKAKIEKMINDMAGTLPFPLNTTYETAKSLGFDPAKEAAEAVVDKVMQLNPGSICAADASGATCSLKVSVPPELQYFAMMPHFLCLTKEQQEYYLRTLAPTLTPTQTHRVATTDQFKTTAGAYALPSNMVDLSQLRLIAAPTQSLGPQASTVPTQSNGATKALPLLAVGAAALFFLVR